MSYPKKTNNGKLISIKSNKYIFPKIDYETDESYQIRRKFFINNAPKNEEEYLNILSLSFTLRGILLLRCTYPEKVIQNLNKYLKPDQKISLLRNE